VRKDNTYEQVLSWSAPGLESICGWEQTPRRCDWAHVRSDGDRRPLTQIGRPATPARTCWAGLLQIQAIASRVS